MGAPQREEKILYTYIDSGPDEDKKDWFVVGAGLCWLAVIGIWLIFLVPVFAGFDIHIAGAACMAFFASLLFLVLAILFTWKIIALNKKIKAREPEQKPETQRKPIKKKRKRKKKKTSSK